MKASAHDAGTHFGPYEIVALLGRGGMGEVYRAKDLRLSREVALKVLDKEVSCDQDNARRFEQEAKAAGQLNHPNILSVYDTGVHDGAPYIVSELLEGQTLRDRLVSGALSARKSVEYAIQMGRGLAAAHDKGIVHRDLKPENLFLTKDGMVKILDFGIAKLRPSVEDPADSSVDTLSHTTPGTVLGTAAYMSPEQVRGLPADQRSDLFSFGIVFLEMMTGRKAFKRATPADTMSAVLREDPTEASNGGLEVPAGALRVVRRCLEKSPSDRFQTARDLTFALEGLIDDTTAATPVTRAAGAGSRGWKTAAVAITFAIAALIVAFSVQLLSPAETPTSYQRLTFRHGKVEAAQFAPDGDTIVHSARWGSNPIELFLTRATAVGERSLGLTDALILSISAKEEMALLLHPREFSWGTFEGTLAHAPMVGGTPPREILEGVVAADWSPDGKELAVVHIIGNRFRLEYPIGTVLYDPDPPTWISGIRVSPKGDQIAFLEHPVANNKVDGVVSIVDRTRRKRTLASGIFSLDTVYWSPKVDEVWFRDHRVNGSSGQIFAVSLSGRKRLVEEMMGGFRLLGVSRTGRVLGARGTSWTEIHARTRGNAEETELPTTDLSFVTDLSDDGKVVLGTDQGQGAGQNSRVFLQRTDGSPPLWLGEGDGQALSPDGRFALALLVHARPQKLLIVPTGPGATRTLDTGAIVRYGRAVWDPTGRRIVFSGIDKDDVERIYVQDAVTGPPRAVSSEDVGLLMIGRPVAPDGKSVVARGPDGVPALYSLSGGEPRAIPGLGELDVPVSWTPDGRELFVAHYEKSWPRVERIDVRTGRRRLWSGLRRSAPTGSHGQARGQARVLVTPDGESYVYSYVRGMSDLYVTSPLK